MNDLQIGVTFGFAIGLISGLLTMYYMLRSHLKENFEITEVTTVEDGAVTVKEPGHAMPKTIRKGTKVQIDDDFYEVGEPVRTDTLTMGRCDCGGLIGIYGTVESGLKCPVCGDGVVGCVACLSCGKHSSCMEHFP